METANSTKKLHTFLFFMGLLATLFMSLPCVILGLDSIVTYHDQLDGELIAYLLQAKHLLENGGIPEFLGGAQKTALIPPAPACVLLFLGGGAFTGFLLMQILESLCGYLGMYLLVKRVTKEPVVGVIIGVLYAYLPFLPVYGLSQYGLPLLLFFILEAEEDRHRVAAFLYAALFALNSSLVLAGFAVLGIMALRMLIQLLQKKERKGIKNSFFLWLMMLGIYIVENCNLLVQVLGGQRPEDISHKTEYRLLPENIWETFLNTFLYGEQHSIDYHNIFLWALPAAAAVALIWMHGNKKNEILYLLKVIAICFGCNVFYALVAALWNGVPGILVRRHLQAVGSFQMDRFLWLAPCLWYLMFGCSLAIVKKLWQAGANEASHHNEAPHHNEPPHHNEASHHKSFHVLMKRLGCVALTVCMAAALCAVSWKVFLASSLKPNLQKLRNSEYNAISFRDYYAIDVLSQVKDFLTETSGCSIEEYRVVSLGIDPAAALYHGFYCLDGYSNNYSLAYKHTFRRVLEPELKKSQYIMDNFDNWGNRCYLFSAECPGYYTIEKGGFYFQNYELDTNALREMGGRYLFSAAYIANAMEQGLTLLRENPFETENSYYRIFVYEF